MPATLASCPGRDTEISFALLPIDTYKKDLDGIVSESLHFDWEALRESIKTHGLRNSTLSALMPSETSSQISNATNGIEPPRGHVSIKASKDGILRQVVPDYENLQNAYELLWEMPNNDGGNNLEVLAFHLEHANHGEQTASQEQDVADDRCHVVSCLVRQGYSPDVRLR